MRGRARPIACGHVGRSYRERDGSQPDDGLHQPGARPHRDRRGPYAAVSRRARFEQNQLEHSPWADARCRAQAQRCGRSTVSSRWGESDALQLLKRMFRRTVSRCGGASSVVHRCEHRSEQSDRLCKNRVHWPGLLIGTGLTVRGHIAPPTRRARDVDLDTRFGRRRVWSFPLRGSRAGRSHAAGKEVATRRAPACLRKRRDRRSRARRRR